MVDFQALSPAMNVAVFALAAGCVWLAGSRLSRYADVIADRTALSEAFVGLLLLAGATSLPELATTVSAAGMGNGALAVGNILGGVAMQTVVLVLADVVAVRGALTFFTPRMVLVVQGVMLIVVLAIVGGVVAIGEMVTVAGVGLGTAAVFAIVVGLLHLVRRYEREQAWEPVNPPAEPVDTHRHREATRAEYASIGTAAVSARFAAAGLVVAVAGWLLAGTGGALAEHTGLDATFVGATLVAISTSLPEVTTTIAAARLGAYGMAVSNVFGSNVMDVSFVFPADLVYRDGAVLETVGPSAVFLAMLGIVLTCVYLVGLLERRDRSVLGMGIDSAVVLVLYLVGMAWLWSIQ